MRRSILCILFSLIMAMLIAPASADVVRCVDDTSVSGTLTAIRAGKLVVIDSTSKVETLIPMGDLEEATFTGVIVPAAPPTMPPEMKEAVARRFPSLASAPASTQPATQSNATRVWHLKLVGNGQLNLKLTSWAAGKLTGSLARSAVAVPDNDTPIEIPIDLIEEAWCGSSDQIRLAKALNEKPGNDDIAFAARDQQILAVRGVAKGVTAEALQFKFDDTERNISLNRLVGVAFAKSAGDIKPSDEARQFVTLTSGDAIVGAWTAIDETAITFQTTWGQSLHIPRKEIARIRSENGRVVNLTSVKPTAVDETPYLDRVMHYQVDRALNGKPQLLSSGPVSHGIAMHSKSGLTYTLPGNFYEFRSKIGFQQPEGRLGDAIVRVKGDGKVLYETLDARGDQPPFDVVLKISDVKQLSIEVDFGSGQDVGDQVIWANPRLIRSAGAAVP